jgi:hypothetical protein
VKSRVATARRLAATAMVVAAAGLVGSVGAAPASAAEATSAATAEGSLAACRLQKGGPTFNAAQATVTAFSFRVCGPEEIFDLPVSIYRNNVKVAEGEGFAVYHCRGTEVGVFSANGITGKEFPCG